LVLAVVTTTAVILRLGALLRPGVVGHTTALTRQEVLEAEVPIGTGLVVLGYRDKGTTAVRALTLERHIAAEAAAEPVRLDFRVLLRLELVERVEPGCVLQLLAQGFFMLAVAAEWHMPLVLPFLALVVQVVVAMVGLTIMPQTTQSQI
jgi:hypothetical protein